MDIETKILGTIRETEIRIILTTIIGTQMVTILSNSTRHRQITMPHLRPLYQHHPVQRPSKHLSPTPQLHRRTCLPRLLPRHTHRAHHRTSPSIKPSRRRPGRCTEKTSHAILMQHTPLIIREFHRRTKATDRWQLVVLKGTE